MTGWGGGGRRGDRKREARVFEMFEWRERALLFLLVFVL